MSLRMLSAPATRDEQHRHNNCNVKQLTFVQQRQCGARIGHFGLGLGLRRGVVLVEAHQRFEAFDGLALVRCRALHTLQLERTRLSCVHARARAALGQTCASNAVRLSSSLKLDSRLAKPCSFANTPGLEYLRQPNYIRNFYFCRPRDCLFYRCTQKSFNKRTQATTQYPFDGSGGGAPPRALARVRPAGVSLAMSTVVPAACEP